MINSLDLLRRHAPRPFGWTEVVVGHDFGILSVREIQGWIRSLGPCGSGAERAAWLEGAELTRFEETLWTACAEATKARVPRPGHQKWADAQDSWRIALLREALSWPLDDQELAEAIDAISTRVGSPEDMLGLVETGCPWARKNPIVDRTKVEAFVQALETRLGASGCAWITLAAS